MISGVIVTLALVVLGVNYGTMDPTLPILPQIFQQFNPFFVVALTPVSLAVFGSLAKKGKEPSAPRKIGIGMGYVKPEYSKVGTEICIDMRGRKLKAVVVRPP